MTIRQSHRFPSLVRRAAIFQAVRDFFTGQGFLEVDTPIRIPAPAPEPFIEAVTSGEWYLQTSPELCMKRLLAAGYPKLFQICKCFRARERGKRHLEEFTMLEWYAANAGCDDLMHHCEQLFQAVSSRLETGTDLLYQGRRIDLSPPWKRLSVETAFARYAPMTLAEALARDAFDEMIAFEIEPHLGLDKPIFLYDYPAAACPLAAPRPGQPHLAQRFELYVAGLELCNGFFELTDPEEQRKRFSEEINRRNQTGEAITPMPEKFLADLRHMPESAGNALGLDRLVMLFADAAAIDAVVAFTPEEL